LRGGDNRIADDQVLLRQDETATVTPLGWLDITVPPMPRGR
jgi:hypothetical protein